jgi:tetratricopeptide (TPR) repeat protein
MALSNFGKLYLRQNNLKQADASLSQSVAIHETCSGGRSLNAVFAANNYADVCIEQGQYDKAETLLIRTREVREAKLPAEHPYLHSLGRLRKHQGQTAEAEVLYREALDIREAALPMDHPHRAKLLEDYAELVEPRGRSQEAAELGDMARVAREKHTAAESGTET